MVGTLRHSPRRRAFALMAHPTVRDGRRGGTYSANAGCLADVAGTVTECPAKGRNAGASRRLPGRTGCGATGTHTRSFDAVALSRLADGLGLAARTILPMPPQQDTNGQTPARRTQSPAAAFLPGLTPLRGIAALWVVLYHYTKVFPALHPDHINRLIGGGYLAVDLFFLLRGFVTMAALSLLLAAAAHRRIEVPGRRYLRAAFERGRAKLTSALAARRQPPPDLDWPTQAST